MTKEPTTQKEGIRTYACTVCGETKTEAIAKKEDTGGSGGSGSGSRGDYGERITSHIHSYSSTVTKPATCTDNGIRTYTCSCGATYMETIPATGHSYTAKVTVEPTNTAEGVITYTCEICKHSYTQGVAELSDASQGSTDVTGCTDDNQSKTENTDNKETTINIVEPNVGNSKSETAKPFGKNSEKISNEDAEATNEDAKAMDGDAKLEADEEENSSTEIGIPETGNAWLIILIAIISVLGIGGILILKKKTK